MGDYESESHVGVASPETLFLILILLMLGTFGRRRRRRRKPYDGK